MAARVEPKHPKHAVNRCICEAASAMRWHLVTPDQESPDTVIDVVVNCLVGPLARAVVEVGVPASQQTVQLTAHLGPRRLISWNQDLANLVLEALHTLL